MLESSVVQIVSHFHSHTLYTAMPGSLQTGEGTEVFYPQSWLLHFCRQTFHFASTSHRWWRNGIEGFTFGLPSTRGGGVLILEYFGLDFPLSQDLRIGRLE